MAKAKSENLLFSILRFPFSKNGWPFLAALFTFFMVEWAGIYPEYVEKYYSTGIYPTIAAGLSFVSRQLSFSLWDVFWIGLIIGIFVTVILMISGKIRFWMSLLRFLQVTAIFYTLFYLLWGFNYSRNPIEKRMEWKKIVQNDEHFLAVFDTLITSANQSRSEISISDYNHINQEIEKAYQNHAKELGISYPNGSRKPKTMLLSSFFAKSGVSGYYGPLFSEVHVNGKALPTEYAAILAHEKAHQFGITSEAEANFIAWYICSTSDDKKLQYSGNILLLRYFLSDAFAARDLKKYLQRFDKKALEDIIAQRSHWLAMRNATLDKAQSAVNDAYLKSNKIDDGIKNYNSVVSMAITYYFNQKGRK
jgi:hypothetical protein